MTRSDEPRVTGQRLLVPWPVDPWIMTGDDMGGLGDAIERARIIPHVAPYCPDTTLAVRRSVAVRTGGGWIRALGDATSSIARR